MNDANAPLNNLDFPNVMSPDAVQRQVSYGQQSEFPSAIEDANVDALITLVQDLNQKNHELLNRITLLEGELTANKAAIQSDRAGIAPFGSDFGTGEGENSDMPESPMSSADDFSADHVSHLLNQLEFAQQANQRQDIRVESLSTQLTSCQSQVEQLEAENSELQQRCGNQLYRLNHLEEECRDLRLRLHRQQRYTLQFKAALEKCLEVPPPSYGFLHARNYAHDMVASFQPESDATLGVDSTKIESTDAEPEDSNWLVQPLLPKIQSIKPWRDGQAQSAAFDQCHNTSLSPAEEDLSMRSRDEWSSTHANDEERAPLTSFPNAHFQATLLTLANEAQYDNDREEKIDESAPESPFTEPSSMHLTPEEPVSAVTEEFEEPSHHSLESVQKVTTPIEEECSVKGKQSVAEQPQDAREAIAPFSDAFSEVKTNPTSATKLNNDKLWQSLVNLIDMSADDGLNIGALPLNKSSHETSDSDHSASVLQADSTSFSPKQPEQDAHVFASKQDSIEGLDREEAQEPLKRAIELPSFLTPTNKINPSPA